MKRLLLKFESLKEDNESTKPRAAWPVRFQPQDVVSELSGGREAKVPARKTTPAKKRAAQTKKTKTATAEVLKTIERHKTGIDIAILKKKTGFPASTIRGIVYRAKKEGKIKRIGRGVYMAA